MKQDYEHIQTNGPDYNEKQQLVSQVDIDHRVTNVIKKVKNIFKFKRNQIETEGTIESFLTPHQIDFINDSAYSFNIKTITRKQKIKQQFTLNHHHYYKKRVAENATIKNKFFLFFMQFRAKRKEKEQERKKILKRFKLFFKKIYLNIFSVWNPMDVKKIIWDLFGLIFILYQMLQVPLVLSFGLDVTGIWYNIDLFITVFYFVDIVIAFNTSYMTAGEFVKDRKRIAINYLKFWFWIDLITTIPYDTILDMVIQQSFPSTSLIRFVRIFRLVKIVRLVRALKLKNTMSFLDEILSLDKTFSTILTVFRLCFLILIIGHWVACLWHSVGTLGMNVNWIVATNIQDSDWTIQYLNSLYFSITTMNTVGYGDIRPYNYIEEIFAIFAMVLASAVFGYVMNSISSIFMNSIELNNKYNAQILVINRFMQSKDLSIGLQSRVRNYFEWLIESQSKSSSWEHQMSQDLSKNLKNELFYVINSKVIKEMIWLEKFFTDALINMLIYQIKDLHLDPETEIDPSSSLMIGKLAIYYVKNGQLNLFTAQGNNYVASIEEKKTFGEVSFFTSQIKLITGKAHNFVTLLYIEQKDFLDSTKSNMDDFYAFHHIKNEIAFNNNLNLLNFHCFACQKPHQVTFCNNIHFHLSPIKRIKLQMKNKKNLKLKIQEMRYKKKKSCTFQNLKILDKMRKPQYISMQTVQVPQSILNNQRHFTKQLQHAADLGDMESFETVLDSLSFMPQNNISKIASEQNHIVSKLIKMNNLRKKKENKMRSPVNNQREQSLQIKSENCRKQRMKASVTIRPGNHQVTPHQSHKERMSVNDLVKLHEIKLESSNLIYSQMRIARVLIRRYHSQDTLYQVQKFAKKVELVRGKNFTQILINA